MSNNLQFSLASCSSSKKLGFYQSNGGLIESAWWGYAEKVESLVVIETDSPIDKPVDYLYDEPPMFKVDVLNCDCRELHGRYGQTIHAAKRVKYNLVHGAKHTPDLVLGRDD